MREIKFRAWVKKDYDGHGIVDYMEDDASCFNNPFEEHRDGNIVLMQYTGLKDKNDVEIYEGDILKWDEKEWGHPFNELVEWDFDQLDMRKRDWAEFCEVIGNIYEKPELLDQ